MHPRVPCPPQLPHCRPPQALGWAWRPVAGPLPSRRSPLSADTGSLSCKMRAGIGEIASPTARVWGVRVQARCTRPLETCCVTLRGGDRLPMSKRYPGLCRPPGNGGAPLPYPSLLSPAGQPRGEAKQGLRPFPVGWLCSRLRAAASGPAPLRPRCPGLAAARPCFLFSGLVPPRVSGSWKIWKQRQTRFVFSEAKRKLHFAW